MPIGDRDIQALKDAIDHNHKSVMELLALRKDYWDERLDKICAAVTEMKDHCRRQQDTCAIVLKDFDKRIDENDTDITKIKTVGSVLMIIWGALVTIATQFIRKIGG